MKIWNKMSGKQTNKTKQNRYLVWRAFVLCFFSLTVIPVQWVQFCKKGSCMCYWASCATCHSSSGHFDCPTLAAKARSLHYGLFLLFVCVWKVVSYLSFSQHKIHIYNKLCTENKRPKTSALRCTVYIPRVPKLFIHILTKGGKKNSVKMNVIQLN